MLIDTTGFKIRLPSEILQGVFHDFKTVCKNHDMKENPNKKNEIIDRLFHLAPGEVN
jgi:hypothetical protein